MVPYRYLDAQVLFDHCLFWSDIWNGLLRLVTASFFASSMETDILSVITLYVHPLRANVQQFNDNLIGQALSVDAKPLVDC